MATSGSRRSSHMPSRPCSAWTSCGLDDVSQPTANDNSGGFNKKKCWDFRTREMGRAPRNPFEFLNRKDAKRSAIVIASRVKRSRIICVNSSGLPRRCAPRNDRTSYLASFRFKKPKSRLKLPRQLEDEGPGIARAADDGGKGRAAIVGRRGDILPAGQVARDHHR